MATWHRESQVEVSIVCAAYNQEQYIREALDGFLAQETSFPFEIVIHDDASTDQTAEIIRYYAARYPEIVKPIYQKENQYSRGGFKPSIYAAGFARGRYIALCEGDDFWICNEKLQVQFDAMERHPEIDFSFHSALLLQEGVSGSRIAWSYESNRVIALAELMTRYSSSFAPTASYFFRKNLIDQLPDWFYSQAPVGDFFIERYGALRGGALYIDRPMCTYREMTPGSWNNLTAGNIEAYGKHVERMLYCLELMAPEFVPFVPHLRRHAANLNLRYALRALHLGNYALFSQLIMASVSQCKYASIKQRLVYIFRFCPTLLKWVLSRLREARSQFQY